MAEETQNDAGLMTAWNTPVPYDQIRTGSAFEKGQYDWKVEQLTPGKDKNGLFTITVETRALAPASIANLPGKASLFTRTLYVGNHKDKMAEQPDTALNNGADRFLKAIAEALKLPCNGQSRQQMCQQLLGKQFGCRIDEGKPYKDAQGKEKPGGLEFGRNITPVGVIPAKLDREGAAMSAVTAAAAPAGSTFA